MVYEFQDDEFMIPLNSSFANEKNGHDQDGWTEPKQHDSLKRAAFWHVNLPIVLFHVLLTCTYTFVAIGFVGYARSSCHLQPACPDRLTYCTRPPAFDDGMPVDSLAAPAYRIATWHVRTIDSSKMLPSQFSGNPGPEVDGAWENLINSRSLLFFKKLLPLAERREESTSASHNTTWTSSIALQYRLPMAQVTIGDLSKCITSCTAWYVPSSQRTQRSTGLSNNRHRESSVTISQRTTILTSKSLK